MTERVQRLRRPIGFFAVLTLALGVTAFITRDQWLWSVQSDSVEFEVPEAPELEVETPDERLFRIDIEQSLATYRVAERLVGNENVAEGSTSAIAGDIIINTADTSASTVGTIVINVETFTSDSSLRDKRLRHDYLESNHFRFVEFSTTEIGGLPDQIVEGTPYELTLTGDLTVKETTAPVTFTGPATLQGDTLTASMTATIELATFDAGPISIAGLATSGETADLVFDLVAVSDADAPEIDDITVDPEITDDDPNSSFSAAVQPVLEQNCASCHVAGGPGHATFALETAGDAAEVASGLKLVTESRYMPGWLASDESVPFHDDRSLSADELAAIADWADAGGTLDVPADTPIIPSEQILADVRRDIVMRGEPYAGDPEVPDDYNCQVYDPQITETSYVTRFEFEPDQKEVVHHAVVFLATANMADEAAARDAETEAPGWTCYGLADLNSTDEGARVDQVMGWAPGLQPAVMPEGSGLKMEPGDFLVVQLHLHYDHEAPLDSSAMVLQMATEEELADGPLDSVVTTRYLGPAEIPCVEGDPNPLCDRELAYANVIERFGAFAGAIPLGLNRLCGVTPEDFAHMNQGTASSSCDLNVTRPGEIVSLLGHMHELGSWMRMTLNPGTPEERILLDIPVWSFEWQLTYSPVESIVLDGDDVIRLECGWDRSLQPGADLGYVMWAEGTGDEMCYSTISTRTPAE